MKKIILVFTLTISLITKADEGMWLPQLLNAMNIKDMKKNGLKLTSEQIYSINKSSLKDAIVQFGGGCTAEIISNQGLILTNDFPSINWIRALTISLGLCCGILVE